MKNHLQKNKIAIYTGYGGDFMNEIKKINNVLQKYKKETTPGMSLSKAEQKQTAQRLAQEKRENINNLTEKEVIEIEYLSKLGLLVPVAMILDKELGLPEDLSDLYRECLEKNITWEKLFGL